MRARWTSLHNAARQDARRPRERYFERKAARAGVEEGTLHRSSTARAVSATTRSTTAFGKDRPSVFCKHTTALQTGPITFGQVGSLYRLKKRMTYAAPQLVQVPALVSVLEAKVLAFRESVSLPSRTT